MSARHRPASSPAPPLAGTLVALFLSAAPVLAGGFLESRDVTGRRPSPNPNLLIADFVPTRWDVRCLPVPLRLDAALDPVPNPLGTDFLGLDQARPELERALETWNRIATSFAAMELAGDSAHPGPAGFDMVSELTFRPPADRDLVAATRLVTLMEDSFLADGTDLDEDGDGDVSAGLDRCGDADGDGDLELPEGHYRAGTILDADVRFNADPVDGFRFTVEEGDVDSDRRSIDLRGVAVHEAGHVHGLAHSLTNQSSRRDGTGSVMYQFFHPGDPVSELSLRVLHPEDATASSALYPEGSAGAGPAALQPGDVAFDQVFSVLTGEIFHGATGLPLVGASVSALEPGSGAVVSTTISGTGRDVLDPETEAAGVFARVPSFHLRDGRFRLPVPAGGPYRLGIEAVDGHPVGENAVNLTATLAANLFLDDYPEELLDRAEGAVELDLGTGRLLPVPRPGLEIEVGPVVTQRVERLGNVREPEGIEAEDLLAVEAGSFLAVRIPAAEVADAIDAGSPVPVTGLFHTFPAPVSRVAELPRLFLARGRLLPDGTARVDLHRALARTTGLTAQEGDLSPWHLPHPRVLAHRLQKSTAGGGDDLFLVLAGERLGGQGLPWRARLFVGTAKPPRPGRSFVSTDGRTFEPLGAELLFQLLMSPEP